MIPRKLTCPLKRDYFSREYIFQPLNRWFSGDMLLFRAGAVQGSFAIRMTRRTPSPIPSCHRCNPGSVMELTRCNLCCFFLTSKTNVTFFPVHIESLAEKKFQIYAIASNIHLQKVHVPARHVSLAGGISSAIFGEWFGVWGWASARWAWFMIADTMWHSLCLRLVMGLMMQTICKRPELQGPRVRNKKTPGQWVSWNCQRWINRMVYYLIPV